MVKRLPILAAILVATIAAGCVSVPMASPEMDAVAKTFRPQHGKANIYVYRTDSYGGGGKMPVMLDAVNVGTTIGKTYLLLEVSPGLHTILSNSENSPTVTLRVAAGRNYFVKQEAKIGGWRPRSALSIVDETTGKAAVAQSNRARGT